MRVSYAHPAVCASAIGKIEGVTPFDLVHGHVWPRRVYIGAGTAETDDETLRQQVVNSPQRLASAIRSMSPRTAVEVTIEPGAGHNGKAWGGRLAGAMKFLWSRR